MGCGQSASKKAATPAAVPGEGKAEEKAPEAPTVLATPDAKPAEEAPATEPVVAEPVAETEDDAETLAIREKYEPQELTILIQGARDLRNADHVPGQGKSDPFCVLEVKGKTNASIKTPTVNDQLQPVWDHSDKIETFVPGDSLEFTVYDEDVGGLKDLLGKATIKRGAFEADGFEGELELEVKAKASPAFLKVKIEKLKPKEQPVVEAIAEAINIAVVEEKIEEEVKYLGTWCGCGGPATA